MKPTYAVYKVGVLGQVAGIESVWLPPPSDKAVSLELDPACASL